VVFWDKQADTLAQYCKKGSLLYVEGKLHKNTWQDKDGQNRSSWEVTGSSFQFISTGTNPNGGTAKPATDGAYTTEFSNDFPAAGQDQGDYPF
jgi:single stranded DNA-binding protein